MAGSNSPLTAFQIGSLFKIMHSCTSGSRRFFHRSALDLVPHFWPMKTFTVKGNNSIYAASFILYLTSSCPFNRAFTPVLARVPEDSDVCYHGSAPLFSFALALLTWPSTVHLCMCVFVRERRRQRLYGPPGSCKKWLMAPWCFRCNCSFSQRWVEGVCCSDEGVNWSARNWRGKKTKGAIAGSFSCTAEEIRA